MSRKLLASVSPAPDSLERPLCRAVRTGYEQVRSVAAALAGDWEAARRVELVLPETGVCNGPAAAHAGEDAAWCGVGSAHSELITIEIA